MPAVIDEPETVNVLTAVDAFGWVALTLLRLPEPAEMTGPPTVLETVATLTLVAPKLDKTTLPP
jgi:hypothetical protein